MDLLSWTSPLHKIIHLELCDITRVQYDAIVNAANSRLVGGGGVDGAIHAAAGPSVMAELDRIRSAIGTCLTGKAVVTGAGKLRAKYIIHAVGPVYRGGNAGEADLLASCYREAFRLAAERDVASIAFPAISTGIYGYPIAAAAGIAMHEAKEFLSSPSSIKSVHFVLFSADAMTAYMQYLK